MRHRLALMSLLIGLAACGMLPGGETASPEAPSPLVAEAIDVTPLDTPAAAEPAEPASPWNEVAPAAPPPAPEVVEAKSPGEIACEERGGRYVALGGTGARTCVTPTRDGGKQCRRDGDCSGQCLARSNTCAPMTPLLGCNEILQSDGRRVTLCLD